jgi:Putative transposase
VACVRAASTMIKGGPGLTPAQFAAKWRGITTGERASAQTHFGDLCRLLDQPTPHEADPTGTLYGFEKALEKTDGGSGFADVWKHDFFGWEYKGKRKDLRAAYVQLLNYREALGNPPLLVVSDLETIEIHTNFTGLSPVTHTVTLDDLAAPDPSAALAVLRAVFTAPEELRPTFEPAAITETAARHFAELAQALRARDHDPQQVAHFLDRILFCLFAEDAKLLPKQIFVQLARNTKGRSDLFSQGLGELFGKMSATGGGMFGAEVIQWFNGGLFDSTDVLPLHGSEITTLLDVGKLDWALIEPAIFGTLFERGLDPNQRAQLGAHYTDRGAMWQLIEPVVIRPLRREYTEMQRTVTNLLRSGKRVTKATPANQNPSAIFHAFLDRLRQVRVLDPACGSGNFLFVSLWALKDLEWEAIQWGSLELRETMERPQIGPEAVLGIEVNAYAAELARVTIWIGEIQWMIRRGLGYNRDPILRLLDHIETRDALLDLADPTTPREAEWPKAEFIVGNPPFLGNRLLRRNLGDEYTEALWRTFDGRLPHTSDLCCYWHEKARDQISKGSTRRAGLLATQAIRSQANRKVLERISSSGRIFFARADDPWVLTGANVHISFVGQDDGSEEEITLDGQPVPAIHSNLTSGLDLTSARSLTENRSIAFYADIKGGPFEINGDTARRLLAHPNPDGRPNDGVVVPWINARDLTGRPRDMWIIDFGVDMTEQEAAMFEAPFEYVRMHVKPFRDTVRRESYRKRWWLHAEPVQGMRSALRGLSRYIATPAISKHRLFAWVPSGTLADHRVIVIARDDDVTLGVLQSRVHELWALRTGARLETRPSYTPTTTFEAFPFPRPDDDQRHAIAIAAANLVRLRNGWLNPAGLDGAELLKRTHTELYNRRPSWLVNAHDSLDAAIFAAYGWPADIDDEAVLGRLLDLNLERFAGSA